MTQVVLRGLAAASGIAVGRAVVLRDPRIDANGAGGESERARAREALTLVAAELGELADRARAGGRDEQAEILEASRMIAEDPLLEREVDALADETGAEAALLRATARHAKLLAALDDPVLAARSTDVRQLGVRAARLLIGTAALELPAHPVVVLARDLGPADVAELEASGDSLRGIALAEGAATSHVAIMARSLGLPMVVALGEPLLGTSDGEEVVLDGENGVAVVAPASGVRRRAQAAARREERRRSERAALRGLPSVTRDGRAVELLCNASSVAEVEAGLAAGAAGVGLLRTELAFLDSATWPSEDEHLAHLAPALALLEGRTATVRTLDFGADKTPPFLEGIVERGVALALAHPDALAAQVRAILRVAKGTNLRILLPLVETPGQVQAVRSLVDRLTVEGKWTGAPPQLGAMIETPEAAGRAEEIAAVADFLSIGTNDLVQYTLGLDRTQPLASAGAAADPAVLRLVATVAGAARKRGISVEVCGEAAGESRLAALLVGLGIDELSIAPARIDEIRALIRRLSYEAAEEIARAAVVADSAGDAMALADELLAEAGDELREARDSLGSILS